MRSHRTVTQGAGSRIVTATAVTSPVSAREAEILRAALAHPDRKTAGAACGAAAQTVSNTLSRVGQRLEVPARDAAREARRRGLLDSLQSPDRSEQHP